MFLLLPLLACGSLSRQDSQLALFMRYYAAFAPCEFHDYICRQRFKRRRGRSALDDFQLRLGDKANAPSLAYARKHNSNGNQTFAVQKKIQPLGWIMLNQKIPLLFFVTAGLRRHHNALGLPDNCHCCSCQEYRPKPSLFRSYLLRDKRRRA
jgi:hypothetical protein